MTPSHPLHPHNVTASSGTTARAGTSSCPTRTPDKRRDCRGRRGSDYYHPTSPGSTRCDGAVIKMEGARVRRQRGDGDCEPAEHGTVTQLQFGTVHRRKALAHCAVTDSRSASAGPRFGPGSNFGSPTRPWSGLQVGMMPGTLNINLQSSLMTLRGPPATRTR